MMVRGLLFAVTGNASDAVQMITSGTRRISINGINVGVYRHFLHIWLVFTRNSVISMTPGARIDEAITAIETTKETWRAAEIHVPPGEIALVSPEPNAAKAEAYFERALAVARQQQAKSWELRAAMSMARLWRDQGKRDEARDLLAPVYGWFTEGFDTLDLKEAKDLLNDLGA